MTQQQLTQEERDYQFSAICYPLRERFVGELSNEQLDTLDSALEELDILLPKCTVRGDNILFFAIEIHAPAVLKFLLDNGASLGVTGEYGKTPLEYAKEVLAETKSHRSEGSPMISLAKASVDLLQSIEDENNSRVKEHGFVALCHYLRGHHTNELTEEDLAKLTLKFGELNHNLNDMFLYKEPPIFGMIHAHAPAIVDFFIQKGVYLGIRNHMKQTPLEYAEAILAETLSKHAGNRPMIALAEETVAILKKHQI